MLTKNYPILEGDPIAREVFERKNLVAGSKRGKNIQELISPTVQKHKPCSQPMGRKFPRGSYQCRNFKEGRKCELCTHMKDNVQYDVPLHLRKMYAIKGHLAHQPRHKKFKDRWFVYLINDDHCDKK